MNANLMILDVSPIKPNQNSVCFVCEQSSDISLFVEAKDGWDICKLFLRAKCHIDFRPGSETLVVGACTKHELNLAKMREMFLQGSITQRSIATARGPRENVCIICGYELIRSPRFRIDITLKRVDTDATMRKKENRPLCRDCFNFIINALDKSEDILEGEKPE